ncbi:MAG: hypothetical protein JW860_14485 [Sedimentisphaerales bacterium]|nr:hypothetical protein [Sedimentisphaerales bacterium]
MIEDFQSEEKQEMLFCFTVSQPGTKTKWTVEASESDVMLTSDNDQDPIHITRAEAGSALKLFVGPLGGCNLIVSTQKPQSRLSLTREQYIDIRQWLGPIPSSELIRRLHLSGKILIVLGLGGVVIGSGILRNRFVFNSYALMLLGVFLMAIGSLRWIWPYGIFHMIDAVWWLLAAVVDGVTILVFSLSAWFWLVVLIKIMIGMFSLGYYWEWQYNASV